jgi:RNA polymerase sigma-70 factor (ECF subfamily)
LSPPGPELPDKPRSATAADEADLAARARAGDEPAFEQLVRMYERPLYNYLYRMCGNGADAEELAQAALVRSWEKLDSFRGASSFKTWLYRIATNLCYNLKSRRKPTEELSEFLPAPDSERPEAEFRQKVREELVRRALDALPADQRSALVLSTYQELSYREIAEAMGKSVRAVDSLLFRAKTNVRKQLADARAKGIV